MVPFGWLWYCSPEPRLASHLILMEGPQNAQPARIFESVGPGRLMDHLGRILQRAAWDDDLRLMNAGDLLYNPRVIPLSVLFRADALHAPCTMPFRADSVLAGGVEPPQLGRFTACHAQICSLLSAIIGEEVT